MKVTHLLDLFTGTGSVARVAEELGYSVTSLDIDPKFHPTHVANILEFDYRCHFKPGDFDVIWASPPCQYFSQARKCNIGRTLKNGETLTAERVLSDTEELGVPLLRRTQEIIEYLQPKVWFIENPYTGSMKKYIPETPAVYDYCMFGFNYRKRTAIWSNQQLQNEMCDRSHLINGSHAMTPIGSSKTQIGQGGGASRNARYAIPKGLIKTLIENKINV